MAFGKDSGMAPVPFVLSALVGLLVAALGSFAVVTVATATPSEPVNKPLISYNSP